MRRLTGSTLIGVCLAVAPAAAQPAKPGAPAATPAPPAQPAPNTAAAPSAPPEAYTYDSDGRRDPFVSLLGGGAMDTRTVARKGEGAAGLALGEISVRGILQSQGTLVAMVEGPDRKTYIVHAGDKLADGTIRSITPQGLVVIQEVNDPLSLVKQREVRKLLRSFEDAKE